MLRLQEIYLFKNQIQIAVKKKRENKDFLDKIIIYKIKNKMNRAEEIKHI